MSTTYSPSATYHTSITVPSDGDNENVASVNPALQNLADNTKYVHDLTAPLASGGTISPSGNITLDARLTANGGLASGAGQDISSGSGGDMNSGRDLSVARDCSVTRNLAVTGTTTCTGTLTANGLFNCNGVASFGAAVTFGAAVEVDANMIIGDSSARTLAVNATTTFGPAVTFNGAIDVNSTCTVDTLIVNGTYAAGGKIILGASSKIVERAVIGVDAAHTYFPALVDIIFIPISGTLTADRIYTIDDTGGVDGMSFEVANQYHGSNFKITVTGPHLDGTYDIGHLEDFCYIKFTRVGNIYYAMNKVAPV